MPWSLADEFTATLIADGGQVTMWEAGLIRTVLAGSPSDVAARWDSPAGRLFRRHFADQVALCAPSVGRGGRCSANLLNRTHVPHET